VGACVILHGPYPQAALDDVGLQPMNLIRAGTLFFLSLSAWLTAMPASAVTVPDLYEISMPVTTSRDAAFVDALKAVVVKVSGRRDAPARLGAALNNPRPYTQRFGFTADNVLQVGFDSVSIDRLLTEAGLPVWGRERPATLVLLNMTSNEGAPRWLDGSSSSAETISRAAKLRGLPSVWTEATAQDQIANGDTAALLQAAARYNANAVLLGTIRSDGAGGASVQWQLASPDANANASGSLEDGVDLAANTFARVYSASGTSLGSVAVEVTGIENLGAYASTLNYLEAMTLVRGVAVEQVSGDTMKFRLAVRGDADTLRRALALDGKLLPQEQTDSVQPADRLRFRYQP